MMGTIVVLRREPRVRTKVSAFFFFFFFRSPEHANRSAASDFALRKAATASVRFFAPAPGRGRNAARTNLNYRCRN